jgi:hypothetical protein
MNTLDCYSHCSDAQARRLRGGRVREFYYYLAIFNHANNTDPENVVRIRLLNQYGSQKSLVHRSGYLKLKNSCGILEYDLQSATIPFPILRMKINAITNRSEPALMWTRKSAKIIRPSREKSNDADWHRELYSLLNHESEKFDVQCAIRKFAAMNTTNLFITLDLLGNREPSPFASRLYLEPAELFEFLLQSAEMKDLQDLKSLIDMPSASYSPSGGGMLAECA